jgi:hypothetical protein
MSATDARELVSDRERGLRVTESPATEALLDGVPEGGADTRILQPPDKTDHLQRGRRAG